ncbi:MAG: haloacid dehalogenase-like hydrolase [Candidatus Sericytochromatia bacterium]|nr:haloacid dehalogenase-like hydrolase [Candidatus Sericytochromatia bacterium]
MRIGLDFDNTLVSYDQLFWELAREQHGLPEHIPVHKQAVRDYLRQQNQEEAWIYLQGEVYGGQMHRAAAFPGVAEFILKALNQGHELFIVSHKTRQPFRGPAYDLHAAARHWLELQHWGLPPEQAYFELSKEAKRDRIAALAVDLFVDDLPEFLDLEGFPAQTQRILFDPARLTPPGPWQYLHDWHDWSDLHDLQAIRA